MDQASSYLAINNMDAEYSTAGQGRAGLALQGNVVQSRARQGASAKQDLHCSFTEEVDSLKY